MTCNEFHQILPEFADGGSAEQQAHLKSCPVCSELVSDLKAISQQARLLRASEEPNPRLWNSIEIALREEGLIRQPQREPRLAVVPESRRWSRAWLLPVTAAVLVVFGLVVFKRNPVPPPGARQASSTANAGQNKPLLAGSDKEDQQLLDMVESRTPALRAAYENELRNVNAYIRDAEQSVETDPNDEEAQQTLMEAYGQKAVVYELAMDRSLP